jgi:hypothetical protein
VTYFFWVKSDRELRVHARDPSAPRVQ